MNLNLGLENLARFLFHKGDFSREKNEVKPRAFTPNRHNQTSVFMVRALADQQIWEIGLNDVAPLRNGTLKGRAEVEELSVEQVGLKVIPDRKDHPLHANIEGWPNEKEERMRIRQDLASLATLKIYNQSA